MCRTIGNKANHSVWSEMCSRITNLRLTWMFEPEETQDAINLFVRDLTATKAKALGWKISKNDDHIMTQYKALLFGVAGSAGDPEAKSAALDMFSKFVNGDKTAVSPDFKNQVFTIAMKFGGEKEYNAILNTYLHPQNDEEKNVALRTLGAATDIKLVKRTLDLAMSKDVRLQDFYMVLMYLQRHPTGVREMWAWAKQNWTKISEMLPPALSTLGTVVKITTSGLTTAEYIQDVENFFKDKDTKGYDQSLAQSLDTLKTKRKWVERDSSDVRSFLVQHSYLKQ